MIDLNQVAMFHAVVRAGSFTGAARELGMPANTLSRHIQQLEEHLGIRLLQRSTRKLTLTHSGKGFHDQSAVQVKEIICAANQLTDNGKTPCGMVRVAGPSDLFDFLKMEWVAEFLEAHPLVQLEFLLSDQHSDLIKDAIDIALRGGPLPDSSYVARQFVCKDVVLAASPSYLKRCGRPDVVKNLIEHECITSTRQVRAVWRLDTPQGVEEVEVSGRFSASTAQSQLRAAIAGLGICLLPDTLMIKSLAAGELELVLPGCTKPGSGFHILYPSRKQIPLAVTAFGDLIVHNMANQ